ncbi:MAG TPA: AgmX/PglI C-terminal domain-containing protein [Polyangiaceae bacterium]|nr:AgmX/PglI C-terminal domain-containing protein [Polyangiaceae bacterium]
MKRLLPLSLLTFVSITGLITAACGGSETPARSADDAADANAGSRGSNEGMSASAEIGALDEAAVDRTFRKTLSGLEGCLHAGARRVEFIGGQVSFYIEVDSSGSLSHARLEESTLGDRETEKCMLGVLRGKRWPKPVGGDIGYARKSFDFDPPNDVRPPTEWESERLSEALEKLGPELEECKQGASGRFKATLYVATDGTPLSVGVTPPDATGEGALDCLADALKNTSYPSPGSWPAKVSFEL